MNDTEPLKTLVVDDATYNTQLTRKFTGRRRYTAPDPRRVEAFIPGVILKVHIKPGQVVRWGAPLLVLEAMKMRNDVTAQHDGVIKHVHVQEGQQVPKGALLLEYE